MSQPASTSTTLHSPAAVSMVVAGRPIGEYRDLREFPAHSHRTDDVVGYVVRETVRDWRPLYRDECRPDEGCGYDVFAVDGAHRYAETFLTRNAYRQRQGGYAVVDTLFACGCRS
ncbi:hypothetical protein OG613_48875 (plasmid) [Streptomyces sp. NBC_00015]|uniref:hypothetical protein n=1 Tax=Streptomyces sp. NBC_00015 TaxID=2903611 RepID=UPI002F9193E2